MALSDTLTGIMSKAPAAKNRVDLLLDRLQGTEDHEVLLGALRNPAVRNADLTKALRIEYKDQEIVRDNSVSDWRRRNNRVVDGL